MKKVVRKRYKMNWPKFGKFLLIVGGIVLFLFLYSNVLLKSHGTYTNGNVDVAPFVRVVGSGDVYIITGDGDSKTTRIKELELPYFTWSLTGTTIVVKDGEITLNP